MYRPCQIKSVGFVDGKPAQLGGFLEERTVSVGRMETMTLLCIL